MLPPAGLALTTVFDTPAQSSGEVVPIEALQSGIVRHGLAHWMALKGARPFPRRDEIVLRRLGPVLRNVILTRVVADPCDAGATDYEFRVVGDALVQGFNENFAGRRLSGIIVDAPVLGLGLRMLYETVRTGGTPLGYRGRAGADMKGAQFVWHENVILPFGGAAVDHLLIVSEIKLHTARAR